MACHENQEWNMRERSIGGGEFRERLLGAIGKTVKGKHRESYGGEEKSAHDERAARRCLEKGLERMGMTADEMRLLKKKDKRKQALGWWLRRQICVDAGWISAKPDVDAFGGNG